MTIDSQIEAPTVEELINDIEMTAAILASRLSPAVAARELRRMAAELDELKLREN